MKAKILTLAILGSFLVGCGGDDSSSTASPLPPQKNTLKAVFPDHLLDQTHVDEMQVLLSGSHGFVIGAVNKETVTITDESSCAGKLVFSTTGSDFVEKLVVDINVSETPTTVYMKPTSSGASNCYHKISASTNDQQLTRENIAVGDYQVEGDTLTGLDKVSGYSQININSKVGEVTLKKISINGKFDHIKNIPISVSIAEGFEDIGDFSFNGHSISDLALPQSLVIIGTAAFQSAGHIGKIGLPEGLEIVNGSAFSNAGLQGKLELPKSLRSIGSNAFAANQIESVVFNSNVTFVEDFSTSGVFKNNKISKLVFNGDANLIEKISPDAFKGNLLESISFPSEIKTIGQSAFEGNKIKELVLPETLTSIGPRAFSENLLESVKLPLSLRSVAGFSDNPTLKTIELNSGLETINSEAFKNTSIEKFVIPNSVTKIFTLPFPDTTKLICFTSQSPVSVEMELIQASIKDSVKIILSHRLADLEEWKSAGWNYENLTKGDCVL